MSKLWNTGWLNEMRMFIVWLTMIFCVCTIMFTMKINSTMTINSKVSHNSSHAASNFVSRDESQTKSIVSTTEVSFMIRTDTVLFSVWWSGIASECLPLFTVLTVATKTNTPVSCKVSCHTLWGQHHTINTDTLHCPYNAGNFLQNPHKRHPIAHP